MTGYENISTSALKETIAQIRTDRSELTDQKIELEKRLRTIRSDLAELRAVLSDMEAELRDREPEVGGTYPHPLGFAYRSLRGRDRWRYEIVGTPVAAYESSEEGYIFYTPMCEDHGHVALSSGRLEHALELCFQHVQKEHL